MFSLIFFTSYLPLLLYTYFRIERLLTKKKNKLVFSLFFVFLATLFPLGTFISRRTDGAVSDFLHMVGFNSLAFFLYLFLTVLLFDLVRLVLFWMFKKSYVKLIHSTTVDFIILFFIPSIMCLIGFYRFDQMNINQIEIDIPQKESQLKKMKILVAADFHLRSKDEATFLERFVKKSNELSPDLVLLVGDIFEGDRDDEAMVLFEEQFQRLKATYGVFAVFGNHETYGLPIEKGFYDRSDMILLDDQSVSFFKSFSLLGRREFRLKNRHDLSGLVNVLPKNLPVFVMDHRPSDYEKAKSLQISGLFSGHTHHGQLFPLNTITEAMYDLSWGHLQKDSTHFFVTSGIRGWGPHVRTAAQSEIMLINVNFK